MYSLPYILLTGFYALLAFLYPSQERERQKWIVILCFAIFLLFFGLRGYVGTDWNGYYPVFEKCTINNLFAYSSQSDVNYELGFVLLMFFCKTLFDSYAFFIFVCTAINTFLLYFFFRRYVDNIPLGIAIFLCMGGMIMQINLVRNSMSIFLMLNVLHYIEERRALPYFSACLVALMLHASSIVFVPLYFFLHKPCNKWVYLSLFVLGNLFFLARIPVTATVLSKITGLMGESYAVMFELYQDAYGDIAGKISFGYIERVMTGILVFCYFGRIHEMAESNKMFVNAFLIYIVISFFFGDMYVVADRLSTLFVFSYWIIWPALIKCFAIASNRKLFVSFLFVYGILKIHGYMNSVINEYDNALFGTKSYEERSHIYQKNEEEIGN